MTYRKIEVSKETPQTPADQPAPMLDWVRIDRMVIDETYQRDLTQTNWTAIRKIAADFHWSRFSPVLLAPVANGQFAVIDGQHRVHAAAICGFETVPAMIVPIDKGEQAKAFSWVNSAVVRITPHHIYKAALAAGESWAVTADASVRAAGCRLMTCNSSSSAKKPGQIYCIGLIRDLVQKGHAEDLRIGLTAIRNYDTQGRVPLYSDYVLAPFISAIAANRAYRALDLTALLQQHDPFKVMNQVDRKIADEQIEGARRVLYRKAFVDLMDRMIWQGKAA
jgi:hypothetical protein